MTSKWNARTPAVPQKVFITRSALQLMQDEARRHTQSGLGENETGGILIGRRLETLDQIEILIVAATGPGDDAFHHSIEFNYDVEHVNQKLGEYRASYPTIDYIGTWHKHPLDYPSFSDGDVHTAHHLFHDDSYKMQEIVNPIVWIDNDTFTIRYYYMHRTMAHQGQPFVELPEQTIQVIDDDDELVLHEQSLEARISEENRRLIERDYTLTLSKEDNDYIFTINVDMLPGVAIYLIAHHDYPHTPPDIIIEQHGEEIEGHDAGIISQWSRRKGRCYLVEIVDTEVRYLASSSNEPPSTPPHQSSPSDTTDITVHKPQSQAADSDTITTGAAPPELTPNRPGGVSLPLIATGAVVVVVLIILFISAGANNGDTAAGSTPTSSSSNVITNAIAPASMTITGEGGETNTAHTFTAAIANDETTTPLHYIWRASEQREPIEATDGLGSTATFTWDTPGTYTITVTATNDAGVITGTHTVQIVQGDD